MFYQRCVRLPPYIFVSVYTRSSLLRSDLYIRRVSFFSLSFSVLGILSCISEITRRFCSFGSNLSSPLSFSVSRNAGFHFFLNIVDVGDPHRTTVIKFLSYPIPPTHKHTSKGGTPIVERSELPALSGSAYISPEIGRYTERQAYTAAF